MKNKTARQTFYILIVSFIVILLALLFVAIGVFNITQQQLHMRVTNQPLPHAQTINNHIPTQINHLVKTHAKGGVLALPLKNQKWLNIIIRLPKFHNWALIAGLILIAIILIFFFIGLCAWAVNRLLLPVTEQSKAAISERTQMLAAISHDLRTPITRLKLRAEYLQNSDQYQKILADLNEMETMLTSVLTFAREDARNAIREQFDLNALLDSLCNDMSDAGFNVSYQGVDKRLPFFGNINTLRRAFSNMLDNAIKYGRQATVRLEQKNNQTNIEIDDNGPGIPDSDLEKVFMPFYRVEQSRSRKTGGTGLGLTIARDAIRSHHGEITLINLPQGGLRILITFNS